MKKSRITALVLSGVMLFSLTSCKKEEEEIEVTETPVLTLEIMTKPPETEPEIIETFTVTTVKSETEETSVEMSTETSTETNTEASTETSLSETSNSETTTTTVVTTAPPVTTESVQTTEPTKENISIVPIEDIVSISKNKGKAVIYNQLSDKEKSAYRKLFNAAAQFKGTVQFDEALTIEEYHKIFCIVFYQNPELFWLQGFLLLNEDGKSATLAYTYSEEEAKSYQKYIDKKVNKLISKLTPDMTDLQKVIICHNWICVNNVFSKEDPNSKNVYGSLANGVAQCEGYAKAMLYLMNKIGVPCILSTGSNSEGLSHAWVKVQVNGEWTNIDPTFNDSLMDEPVDYTNVSYRYMGVPDKAIYGYTHFDANSSPIDYSIKLFEAPKCETYSLNADINYGNYAETYEQAFEILKNSCLDAVEKKKRCVHVKISNNEAYEETLRQLVDEKHIFDIRKIINDEYGKNTVKAFAVSPKNQLNYVEVTMYYGEGS